MQVDINCRWFSIENTLIHAGYPNTFKVSSVVSCGQYAHHQQSAQLCFAKSETLSIVVDLGKWQLLPI
jgi:hypothetical protein